MITKKQLETLGFKEILNGTFSLSGYLFDMPTQLLSFEEEHIGYYNNVIDLTEALFSINAIDERETSTTI